MLIPVRCFTCGKPVGEYWESFEERTLKGEAAELVLNELGFNRYCCRRMFLGQVDLIDEILPYQRF
ncbi:MAG TPA: DNA-directed RNA polymerase subunit N [Candidatus Norongarragalinales archaeon]|nr:DNA-directed RNA polymerase subunit N [Candidatus Norongarragalinales archaeon]